MASTEDVIRRYHLQARRRKVWIHVIAAAVLALLGLFCLSIYLTASEELSRYTVKVLIGSIGLLFGAVMNVVAARRIKSGLEHDFNPPDLPPVP